MVDELFEYWNTGDDLSTNAYGANQVAQTFLSSATVSHSILTIKLKLLRVGTLTFVDYPLTVSIYAANPTTFKPTGNAIATVIVDPSGFSLTGAFVTITFATTPVLLPESTYYTIVLSLPTGDTNHYIGWRYDTGSTYNTNTLMLASDDSGATWTASAATNTLMFEVWGLEFLQPPNESRDNKTYEDYRVPTAYCTEADVYGAIGQTSTSVMNITSKTATQVTTQIDTFIDQANERIRRLMGVPITVRKEGHEFFNNPTVQLGPDREDPFEMFGDYDSEDRVEEIYAIYYNEYRTKIPYPKDWDQFTESTVGWGVTGGTMTRDTDDFKCGTASLKSIMASAGNIQYPKTHNLHKRIYPWFYVGFWFKSSTASATFTFRIVRSTGSYYYGTFTVSNADTWEVVMLNIRRFQFVNAGGDGANADFNWILTYTEYIEITCDQACTFWLDNFNFNDGFFATYPEGTICWCMPEWYPMGRVSVTYSFDPFKTRIPPALQEAAAKLAGVLVLDWLIGYRQSKIAFDEMADTLAESPDRETLENTRRRLENEAMEALATLGFKGYGGIG